MCKRRNLKKLKSQYLTSYPTCCSCLINATISLSWLWSVIWRSWINTSASRTAAESSYFKIQQEVSVADFHTDILESQNTIMLGFAWCFTSSKAEEWLEAVVFSFSTVVDVSRSCNRTMSCKPFRPVQYKSFRPETFSFILPDTWKNHLANIQWLYV